MKFTVDIKDGKRRGTIETKHGVIQTPVFMPVGTVGSVKGISPDELKAMGAEIILGNTYHLYLRPGDDFIAKAGGLQQYTNWQGPMLTDSGGYQVFSLGENKIKSQKSKIKITDKKSKSEEEYQEPSFVKITEDGALFRSHIDGSEHMFTPEKVIDIQLNMGADIIMPLDFCPSAEAQRSEIEKAVDMTTRWFRRAWEHFEVKTKNLTDKPSLFPIVQGGTHADLRKKSFEGLAEFPVDGWAIGGVANAGESKEKQKAALEAVLPLIPEDKPRYLMGVGEPEDLILGTSLGVDMFDCVLPTRLGRHGTIWHKTGEFTYEKLDLRKSAFREDLTSIDENCQCYACANKFSRAYISHLIREHEMLGSRLTTMHNLYTILDLMRQIRQ